MSDQEPEMENVYFQEPEEGGGGGVFDWSALNRLAMLGLNNLTTTTNGSPAHNCTECCGSVKRRSPSSLSSLQEPKSKKLSLHPSSFSSAASTTTSTSASAAADLNLRGFTKVPLPVPSPIVWAPPSTSTQTPSIPTLRRCTSDPIGSPVADIAGALANPLSPENVGSTPSPARANSSASATLPPLPPTLRRSISDPIPTPQDPIKGESPNTKRLMRMKDRMREMSQWWDQVLREEEEEEEEEEEAAAEGGSQDISYKNVTPKDESESEEAVSVEKSGKCLIIHINCPCGKGYQVLLSGKNCYYKLM